MPLLWVSFSCLLFYLSVCLLLLSQPILPPGVSVPLQFATQRPQALSPQQFLHLTAAIFGTNKGPQGPQGGPQGPHGAFIDPLGGPQGLVLGGPQRLMGAPFDPIGGPNDPKGGPPAPTGSMLRPSLGVEETGDSFLKRQSPLIPRVPVVWRKAKHGDY